MSTLQPTTRVAPKGRDKGTYIIAALGALIAVTAATLVLIHVSPSSNVTPSRSSADLPLVHYHGTGAAPVADSASTAPTAGLPVVHYHGTGAAPVVASASTTPTIVQRPATASAGQAREARRGLRS